MTEPGVFMIVNLTVTDPATYREYEKGFFPLLKKHGGQFVTFDDAPKTLEGTSPPTGRMIIFKFPSEAAVDAWYADPEYQQLSEHRRAGTTLRHLTMVREMPPRS